MSGDATCASWFSGAGGLDLGFERARFRLVSHSEIDPYANAILERHWPTVPNLGCIRGIDSGQFHFDRQVKGKFVCPDGAGSIQPQGIGDRTDLAQPAVGWLQPRDGLAGDERPEDAGRPGYPSPDGIDGIDAHSIGLRATDGVAGADIWIGGPPCVGFSVAGQRGGLDDPRSGLVLAWFDLVERYRPSWLVFENVPGLFSSHRGRDFAVLVGTLEKLGYGVAWRTLDARYFGVPQRRRRIFLVAGLGTNRAREVLFESEGGERNPPLGGAPEQGPADGAYHSLTATSGKHHDPDTDSLVGTLDTTFGHHGRADTAAAAAAGHYIVAGPEDVIAAPVNGKRRHDLDFETYVPIGEARVRRITPLEAERLQGWPDGHTIPLRWRNWTWDGIDLLPEGLDSGRYRACENGVATPVAHWVARRLRAAM